MFLSQRANAVSPFEMKSQPVFKGFVQINQFGLQAYAKTHRNVSKTERWLIFVDTTSKV